MTLYLEKDISRVGLGAALLQTLEGTTCQKDMVPDNTILHPIAFASKSLMGTVCRYSNIEMKALGILYGLEKFHHYCFAREVYVITDHTPLVSIFKKRCGNAVTMNTVNSSKNSSIQDPNPLQTRT